MWGDSSFADTIELVAKFVDALGVATVVGGALVAAVLAMRSDGSGMGRYRCFRRRFGRAILLGLEFLVAADIIRTVAIEPTLSRVASLGLIVVIRTFLSFSLEVELEGRWPWQAASVDGRTGDGPSRAARD